VVRVARQFDPRDTVEPVRRSRVGLVAEEAVEPVEAWRRGLRSDCSAARAGEDSAVAWMSLQRTPFAAGRSSTSVRIGPPKVTGSTVRSTCG
jgi:hypothetical protein